MAAPRNEDTYREFLAYLNETNLYEDLKSICLRHHVTLRDIFFDIRGPTVYAARVESWWWLASTLHKSNNEIGRLFCRDSSSILHAMAKLRNTAVELGKEIDSQDAARDAARAMSRNLTETRVNAGRANKKPAK